MTTPSNALEPVRTVSRSETPRGDAPRRRWAGSVDPTAVGFPVATLLMVVVGAAFASSPFTAHLANPTWMAALIVLGGRIAWRTIAQAVGGHFATDVVATMAIVTAIVVDQPLPGLIVVLMQSGGEALEAYARGRASRAVRALEDAAPRLAHRIDGDSIIDIDVEDIRIGDRLLIRPGEIIPCDAVVEDGRSHVDTSRLTGEPVPESVRAGAHLISGTVNGEGSFTARATAPASESQYARIVDLVRSAQASKAPLQRVADRYAVWFTPITIAACALAWLLTRDPTRVLAILVVATPCPLILAVPVAIIGGLNRAARRQIIFRHGGAVEQLGAVTAAAFDKTGTLTVGLPSVSRIIAAASAVDEGEILRLAAAVEQGSGHLLARTVVQAAVDAGVRLTRLSHVTDTPGRGVVGEVDGHDVTVGARSFVLERHPSTAADMATLERRTTGLRAFVAVDGTLAGVIEFADRLRPNVSALLTDLRGLGIARTVLLSGDDQATTEAAARAVGIGDARGDLLPAEKVETVRELIAAGERVLMVGDGTNDAPALGAATIGIALAGHGGGISAEAADVVLLVDDVTRVADAIRISRRTLRVARQSIWIGLGLSGVAMGFAGFGLIAPIIGALLQEAIDVAVIVNALRTSR